MFYSLFSIFETSDVWQEGPVLPDGASPDDGPDYWSEEVSTRRMLNQMMII